MAGPFDHTPSGPDGQNARIKKLQDQIDAIRGRSVLKNAVSRTPLPFQTSTGDSIATVGEFESAYFNGSAWVGNTVRGIQASKVGDSAPYAHIAHAVDANRIDVVLGYGDTALSIFYAKTGEFYIEGPAGSTFYISPAGAVQITAAAGQALSIGPDVTVSDDLVVNDSLKVDGNVGFYGQSPVSKPTVSGSRSTGAALNDLLNELANQGLITNSTSP